MAREMKDSGTAWLDKIPESWELSKISSIYELRTQKVSDRDYPPLSVTMHGVVPQLDTAAKTNAHDDRKLVRKGDFTINSRSDRRGSCGVSEYDGSVSLINTVMKPRDEMNPDYYNWLFHTTQFADEFYKWGHGIVDDLWTTNWRDMKHIDIPVPSLPEQKKIADYLNKIVPEIDSLSSDIQSQIHILEDYKKSVITEAVAKGLEPDVEMKDSGIEWIGIVPTHWEIFKYKHLANLVRGGSPRPAGNPIYYYGDIPFMKVADITKDDTMYVDSCEGSIKPAGLSNTRMVNKGTLLLTNSGATLGIPKILNMDTTINDGIAAFLNLDNKLDIKFAYYSLKCKTEYFLQVAALGMGQPNLNTDIIGNTYVVIPSKEEQQVIVCFLDEKCAEIDAVIAKKREQLEVLEQYKKSMIYEYVTGKREVPDNNG